MEVSIILAVAENGVIGSNNTLVWKLKTDLQHFKKLTSGNVIIMGRKTYDSLNGPLPNRLHIIITRDENFSAPNCIIAHSLEKAIEAAKETQKPVFIIGGGQIYEQSLQYADRIYLTKVFASPQGDTYFDLSTLQNFKCIKSEIHLKDDSNEHDFAFEEYIKII